MGEGDDEPPVVVVVVAEGDEEALGENEKNVEDDAVAADMFEVVVVVRP